MLSGARDLRFTTGTTELSRGGWDLLTGRGLGVMSAQGGGVCVCGGALAPNIRGGAGGVSVSADHEHASHLPLEQSLERFIRLPVQPAGVFQVTTLNIPTLALCGLRCSSVEGDPAWPGLCGALPAPPAGAAAGQTSDQTGVAEAPRKRERACWSHPLLPPPTAHTALLCAYPQDVYPVIVRAEVHAELHQELAHLETDRVTGLPLPLYPRPQ